MSEPRGSPSQAGPAPGTDRDAAPAQVSPASAVAYAPVLTVVALVASTFDLAINRVVLRTVSESTVRVLHLERCGDLARNLAAVAGIVALAVALIGFMRLRPTVPLRRRLVIAAFAGLFLPMIGMATVLPAERTTPQSVLFAAGAAHVLTVLIALVGVRWRAPLGLRVGIGLLALASLCALASLVVGRIGPNVEWATAARVATALRRTGELGYLVAPIAIGVGLLPRLGRLSLACGGGVLIAVGTLAFVGHAKLGEGFAILLYGAQGVELLLTPAAFVYAFPLSLAFGAGVGIALSRQPAVRQVGMGLLLVLCGGFEPRPPGESLMMVLGMALLSRAAVAIAQHAFEEQYVPPRDSLDQLDRELER